MTTPAPHFRASLVPSPMSQALALLVAERDHYRAEAEHLRLGLKTVRDQAVEPLIRSYAARMLLYEPYQRPRRHRMAMWWDRNVRAWWTRRMA